LGEYGPGASALSGMMLLYWEATNFKARFTKLPKLGHDQNLRSGRIRVKLRTCSIIHCCWPRSVKRRVNVS
jgi:hypothetical protein